MAEDLGFDAEVAVEEATGNLDADDLAEVHLAYNGFMNVEKRLTNALQSRGFYNKGSGKGASRTDASKRADLGAARIEDEACSL